MLALPAANSKGRRPGGRAAGAGVPERESEELVRSLPAANPNRAQEPVLAEVRRGLPQGHAGVLRDPGQVPPGRGGGHLGAAAHPSVQDEALSVASSGRLRAAEFV